MSDSVSSVEIEDVLSSIRRLVSVDSTRPRQEPAADDGGRDTEVDARSDPRQGKRSPDSAERVGSREPKLVLTADLRVPDSAAQDAPSSDGERPVSVSREAARAQVKSLERRIAELEAAVNAQSTDFEPDGSEDAAQHRPTSVLSVSTSPADAEPASDPKPEADPAPDAMEQAVDRVTSTGSSDHDPADGMDGVLDVEILVTEMMDGHPGSGDDPDAAEIRDRIDAGDTPEVGVESVATCEDVAAPGPSDEAPDMAHIGQETSGVFSFTAFENMRNVEVLDAETRQKTRARAAEEPPAGDSFSYREDEALIDEDTLRDMVAEIVRQELQGALGERITRNVRKLVRREIMRAISIRDFE